MNPLQKYKLGSSFTAENSSKNIDKPIQNKVQKMMQENVKKEVNNQSNKVQLKKVIPDFTVFDKVVKTNKPPVKPAQNLLNLDEQKTPDFAKNVSFDDFQFGTPNDKNK